MQLTDTQLVVLSAALNRDNGSILPLPANLKGGAVAKVCAALIAKGLAEEIALNREAARAAPEQVFRSDPNAEPVTLRITDLARQALNVEMPSAGDAPEPASVQVEAEAPADQEDKLSQPAAASADQPAADAPQEGDRADASGMQPRSGTKLEQFIQLLRRPEGVSIKEAAQALDWMEHSVRGAVAGALKKMYGLTIPTAKVEGRRTVYTVAS